MKTLPAALAAVLAVSAVTASTAQAVTPKTGKWKVKLDGATLPPGARAGGFRVIEKNDKLYVKDFLSPEYYVKCSGRVQPVEMNPGFPTTWGAGKVYKLGRSAKFSGRFPTKNAKETRTDVVTATFSSSKKASGTVRTTIKGDSGALKWKATR
jgi:hypothetical protein